MKKTILLIFLIYSSSLISQDKELKNAVEAFMSNDIELTNNLLPKISNSISRTTLQWHVDAFLYGIKDSIIDKVQLKFSDKKITTASILNLFKTTEILETHYFQKDSTIYETLKKALVASKKINDTTLIRLSYRKLIKHVYGNSKLFDFLDKFSEEFKPYIKTFQDETIYNYYKYTAIAYNNNQPQIIKYQEVLDNHIDVYDPLSKGILNQIIGISESYFNNNDELAILYIEKAIKYYEQVPGFTGNLHQFKTNNNLGYFYNKLKQPEIALIYLRKALKFPMGKNNLLSKSNAYLSMAQTHENLKNFDSAYYYSKKEKSTLKEFNEYETAIKQREIETKYQTAEKEKQILIEQQKKKQNSNIAFALGTVLLFVAITAFLIQKNTKRKQLLAEQEKALETQKLTTVLKEQELIAIDAMIEGQEKERQRMANDLHDDLGGLMANVKMHFNALKDKQSEDLFNKTDRLLDEAYQKVRTVAHAKNSGVIAKQGLLKAVQNMAGKVSANNQIQIEVVYHNLESRFENSLELTLFRIIQELITNVIKHAEATEATIHITNHDDSLNIMVEDNGKGFNTKNIPKASGMGIHSIDKRIENLGGTVTIESEKNKGTSVIIDIPS